MLSSHANVSQPARRKASLSVAILCFRRPLCCGLIEPVFVPIYWNPPSLFELARRTSFDIESLIFTFAIGGTGVALYLSLAGQHLDPRKKTEEKELLPRLVPDRAVN